MAQSYLIHIITSHHSISFLFYTTNIDLSRVKYNSKIRKEKLATAMDSTTSLPRILRSVSQEKWIRLLFLGKFSSGLHYTSYLNTKRQHNLFTALNQSNTRIPESHRQLLKRDLLMLIERLLLYRIQVPQMIRRFCQKYFSPGSMHSPGKDTRIRSRMKMYGN